MTDKTEERIAAEKEAVQKMVGAKGAMDAALSRIDRLETLIKHMAIRIDEVAKNIGDGTLMKTYYGKGQSPETLPMRKLLESIASDGRGIL